MLKYELAKKLKDAGFPFNPKRDWDKSDWFWLPIDKMTKDDREKCYIPTPSELIDACGDKFWKLHKGKSPIDAKWTAHGWNGEYIGNTNYKKFIFGQGNDKEEAVANLWLKLND